MINTESDQTAHPLFWGPSARQLAGLEAYHELVDLNLVCESFGLAGYHEVPTPATTFSTPLNTGS